jgi:hypothetical protein
MKRVEWARRESATLRYNHPWGQDDVTGLSVDYRTRTIVFPPNATEPQKKHLRDVLLREEIEQTGQRGKYHRQWYGRIAEHYRGSRTLLIFLQLPRGPIVRPRLIPAKTAAARDLAREYPNVRLLPDRAFDALEKPEYFGDAMHLNGRGGAEFSRVAAREVAKVLR